MNSSTRTARYSASQNERSRNLRLFSEQLGLTRQSTNLVERGHRGVVVLDGVLHVVRRVLPVEQAPRGPQGRRVGSARGRRAVLLLRLRVRDRRGRGRGSVVAVSSGTWVAGIE